MPEDSPPRTKYLSPASLDRGEFAIEAGDDIERQVLQFEADIKRDQVIGRDHDHHPGRRQQDQHREFETADPVLLVVVHPHDDRDRRADQHQRLHEHGKGVGDEHAVKADAAFGRRPTATTTEDDDQRRTASQETSRVEPSPRQRSQEQQRHRRRGEHHLRQCRQTRSGKAKGGMTRALRQARAAQAGRVGGGSRPAPPDGRPRRWIGRRNELG